MEDGAPRPVKRVAVAAAAYGDKVLIAAVTGRHIRVIAQLGIAAAALSIYFTSNPVGTVIFGGSTNKIALAANGGFVLDHNPDGWFQTSVSQSLVLNLSAASAFAGGLCYVEF